MYDKWIEGLPDEIPDEVLDEVEDPLVRVEIIDLHKRLKLLDQSNHQRLTTLFEKEGVMFRNQQDVHLRLQLLIEMFIGHLSPERLNFEIRWATMKRDAIEVGYAEHLEAKRQARESQSIVLPGGATHIVPAKPKETDGN